MNAPYKPVTIEEIYAKHYADIRKNMIAYLVAGGTLNAESGMFEAHTGRFYPEHQMRGKTRFEGDGLFNATRYTYIEVAPEQAKPSSPEIPDNLNSEGKA